MKMKTLAVLVGSMSLGALVTGCASNKASEQPAAATATEEKGAQGSCGAGSCSGAKEEAEAADSAAGTEAETTPEKGTQGSCGAGSCSGS